MYKNIDFQIFLHQQAFPENLFFFSMTKRDQFVILFLGISIVVLIYSILQMNTKESTQNQPKKNKPTIAVVGCGLAGLSAALEAADNGSKVFLLEKESRCGIKINTNLKMWRKFSKSKFRYQWSLHKCSKTYSIKRQLRII